jgi:uncharacterized protein (DUF885 family)
MTRSRSISAYPSALLACSLLICSVNGAAGQDTASTALKQLLDDAWEDALREDPLFATYYGDRRYNDRLPQVGLADQERQLASQRKFLERLKTIDRAKLTREDQINYDIFARLTEDTIAEAGFQTYLMPITNRSGFHVEFPELFQNVPLQTVQDYENYIARLNAFDAFVQQHIELMRRGIVAGMTLPADVLRGYAEPLDAQILDDPTQSLLFTPFKDSEFPDRITAEERTKLTAAGREAIAASVVPGYRRMLEFMRGEYVPAARGTIGASALPNGREFYRHRVRRFTTLDLTPQEVHDRGLSEVRRIRNEMEEIMRRVDFKGDFAAFVEFLRTDPRFYVDTPEELMKEVSLVLKKMDGQLPKLFKTLPRMPYGIREVPDYIAPATTTAYYQGPAGDGTRAGFYYVNTFNLKARPLYEIEALSLHEAVPGHHLQIALQQELQGLPPMRRFAGFTAFIEGWGLYSERLGLETGFYEDPYSDFGRLSYEMWRACRLVVDTGMHYLGWSRQQAIDFMAANSALTILNITNEVDRYISWPGQAIAYKTGELKIRELRARAEDRLGGKFDVREFHDVVLGSGAVPLTVLEANVEEWVERVSGEAAR